MFRILYCFLGIFILIGCGDSNSRCKNAIGQYLGEEYIITGQRAEMTIVLLSEYDCESCVERLYHWITQKGLNFAKGLYFGKTDSGRLRFADVLEKTEPFVEWKISSNNDLFGAVNKCLVNSEGPYVIYISNGKVGQVESINGEKIK